VSDSSERLLNMSTEELRQYFSDMEFSTKELMSLLREFGIQPTRKPRGKLSDFAAREIRELGVFQRISKGRPNLTPNSNVSNRRIK
jgi:hypothetical protein